MTLDDAWAEAELAVRRLGDAGLGYFSLMVMLDGPGYVARWRDIQAWSVDDPEIEDYPDTPSTPANALVKLTALLKEELNAHAPQSPDR